MKEEKTKFSKWRLLGLIPIAIWLYNLIINLFIIPERFGAVNAPYAWHYNFFSCPLMGLVLGLGILLNNKLLTGAGLLWGLFPVFMADILMITPTAREVTAAQGFSIPFLKFTPEYQMIYEQWVGKTGATLILIEEFSTHWLGNFIFGIIGLIIIGISKWSFLVTAASFLFTAWFTNNICPFAPPEPPGTPSLFVKAIPMIIIWFILNISIHGFLYHKDKKRKIHFAVLTVYWMIALLIFNSLAEDTYIPLLPLGYLIIYLVGLLVINLKNVKQSIKNLYAKKVKGLLYAAIGYLILFSAFFFLMMRPNLINEGGNPLIAFILFGALPFLVLFLLGLVIIPLLKKKDKPAIE